MNYVSLYIIQESLKWHHLLEIEIYHFQLKIFVKSFFPICKECKPRLIQPEPVRLVKALQSFQWINIEFKGKPPSVKSNKYNLTIVNDFSTFWFALACWNVETKSVVRKFCKLFSISKMPAYVHLDTGSSFMKTDLETFLHNRGIATGRTTP